jgi:hypothetical protein
MLHRNHNMPFVSLHLHRSFIETLYSKLLGRHALDPVWKDQEQTRQSTKEKSTPVSIYNQMIVPKLPSVAMVFRGLSGLPEASMFGLRCLVNVSYGQVMLQGQSNLKVNPTNKPLFIGSLRSSISSNALCLS